MIVVYRSLMRECLIYIIVKKDYPLLVVLSASLVSLCRSRLDKFYKKDFLGISYLQSIDYSAKLGYYSVKIAQAFEAH